MMTIKDLSISKELDSKAMTEVRGGFGDATQVIASNQNATQVAEGLFVAANSSTQNQSTVAVNEAYAQVNKVALLGSIVI
jgi:hypothetical protein